MKYCNIWFNFAILLDLRSTLPNSIHNPANLPQRHISLVYQSFAAPSLTHLAIWSDSKPNLDGVCETKCDGWYQGLSDCGTVDAEGEDYANSGFEEAIADELA